MDATLLAIFVGLAFSLLIANVLTTRHVWRDPRRTKSEKVAETGLIWLVPVFGPLVSLAISVDGPEAVREADPIATITGAAGAGGSF